LGQLEEMQVFVRVVEAGSLVKAADQLGIAKSAVSRSLKQLEQRLGVELMHRTTRASSLTDAGRMYYQRAQALLQNVAELNADAGNRHSQLEGSLHIAAPLSFGLAHLTPAIEEFCRQHPQLLVQMNFSDRQIDLVEEGVDLAIRIGDLSDSSLRARRISPIQLCLYASPDYLKRYGEPADHTELSQHHLLRYDSSGGNQWRLTDTKGDEHRIHVQPKFSANNGDFLREMAIAGMGIILSPTFICWEAAHAGKLVKILEHYRLPQLNAYVVYPATRFLSQRARIFIDFLAERFGDAPYWD